MIELCDILGVDLDYSKMTKMFIPSDDEEGFSCGETLWVTILNNGNYRIQNTPLYQRLRFGDIVKASIFDDRLTFDRLVMRTDLSEDEE